MVKIVNRWDSQSQQVHLPSGICSCLCSAHARWGGIAPLILDKQYTVDFGRTADRIQIEATKSTTLSAQGGGMGAKTGLYCLPKGEDDVEYIVRRLTPLECERLQGLPDGFTDIEFKGKPAPDSKRYKAIGNGMAHPCASFVLAQIVKAERG